jgi:hypothetical protein
VQASDITRAAAAPASSANGAVSKQTALRIRLEIERLACALDDRDLSMMTAMAGRIAAVAAKDGLPEIEKVATTLEQNACAQQDLEGILRLTNELLQLCRSSHSLDVASLSAKPVTKLHQEAVLAVAKAEIEAAAGHR